MTTAATLNRSDIMQAAWAAYRNFYKFDTFRPNFFARELRQAWFNAKAVLRSKTQTEAECIQEAISVLESKDHWNARDYAKRSELANDLTKALGHEAAAPEYAEKADLITSAGGRFCAVTFIKADGSERVMQVQPAKLAKHVKGDAATDAGKRAVATRKARHPNLLPVWDVKAKAPRSINLATVTTIAVDGMAYAYS